MADLAVCDCFGQAVGPCGHTRKEAFLSRSHEPLLVTVKIDTTRGAAAFESPRRVGDSPLHQRRPPTFDICNEPRPDFKPSRAMALSPPSPPTTKGWTPECLVSLGPRMKHVPRFSAVADHKRLNEIIKEYEGKGVPLIIQDWHRTPLWPGDKLFGFDWLLNHGEQMMSVRDCVTRRDKDIPFQEFIEKNRAISEYVSEGESERLYGKDAVCPKEWKDWLLDSAIPEVLKLGSAEDVLELLPKPERVETLMCYYGIGDTFTAAHKDLCASSGQNLMCSAERDGSAFWFMTQSSDAPRAAAYFQKLGTELDHESHVATPEEFAKAPFTVYVAEQRVGDLVLVPRRSCHQVVNHGGLTAKMSWSRMTIEGLVTAFHHELPIYRRVCRAETYRVRLTVYRALLEYIPQLEREQQKFKDSITSVSKAPIKARPRVKIHSRLDSSDSLPSPVSPSSLGDDSSESPVKLSPEHERLLSDVRTLLEVYDKILQEEHHGVTQCELRIRRLSAQQDGPSAPTMSHQTRVPRIAIPDDIYNEGLTCDFCGADIFQSFFECRDCSGGNSKDDSIVVCPGCYVEGRSCDCTIMKPVQQYPMNMLLEVQNRAQKLVTFEGYGNKDPRKHLPLSHQLLQRLDEHPKIFVAACQLLNYRSTIMRRKNATHSCRKNIQKVHVVPCAGALNCKTCHGSRCFKHILQDGLHVVEALKLYERDKTDKHQKWHEYHKKDAGTKRLAVTKPIIIESQRTGRPCDMSVNLVLHAEMYSYPRPMSNKVKSGWYDDASYIGLESEVESEPGFEGFTGPALGEGDGDRLSDTISHSSDPEFIPTGKKTTRPHQLSGLKIVIPARPPQLTSPRQDIRIPINNVFVEVNKLTPDQREMFFLKRPRVPTPISLLASTSSNMNASRQSVTTSGSTTKSPSRNSSTGRSVQSTCYAQLAVAISNAPAFSPPRKIANPHPKPTAAREGKGLSSVAASELLVRKQDQSRGPGKSSSNEKSRPKSQTKLNPSTESLPPAQQQPKPRRLSKVSNSASTSSACVERLIAIDHDRQSSEETPSEGTPDVSAAKQIAKDNSRPVTHTDEGQKSTQQTSVGASNAFIKKRTTPLPKFKKNKRTEESVPAINTDVQRPQPPSSVSDTRSMPLGSNTLSASEIQLDSVESYPLSHDQWPESSSFPIEPRTHALPPAISSVSGQPAPTEPISEVPDPSNSALFEFLRRLERNGQDIRENLLELHMEIRTLKEENMRLRQQQSNAPPAFVCGTNANANVHGGQWQPDGPVSHGGSQLAFNGGNYFAPGQQGPNSHNGGYVRQNEYWNSRNDSQASRMSPPESPPDRLNPRRRASPYQPIEDRTRWKKWWDVGPDGLNRAPAREQNDLGNAGSLANSRPIEVHHHQDVNNQCERKRTRSDTAEPPRRPRYDEPRMNRQRHVSMNDDYKRRKFGDEEIPPAQPSSSSLQLYMPVQNRIEEDDPYVPDEFASLPPARPVIPTGPRRDARLQTHAR